MDVKKEPVSQDSDMKQAKRDVSQTLADMQAHASLKFTIPWLQL